MELNKYSKHVTSDPSQPAAQAMLHAIGLTSEDLKKPQIGIASTGWEGNPCNMHLNDLAKDIKGGVAKEDIIGLIFHTIGVSDGISMGTAGMRFSLPSRDVIADSIETVASAQWYDALVAVVGCDKNMPGAMMALGRLNRPGIVFFGGTIGPGCHAGKDLTIISTFEALGERIAGNIEQDELDQIIKKACPGPGACGGMYTANTMASAIEAMGMALPYNSSNPAVSKNKQEEAAKVGAAINNLLIKDIKPRDIVTKAALENAMKLVTVLGGSTNAVLHLLAIARSFDLELELADFQRITDSTPFLADLKPSGKYVMEDLHNAGGVPAVMKLMLKEGMIDGTCMTVTGKTIAENLAQVPGLKDGQKVIYPVSEAIKETGHLQMLFGNLAPEGSVAKITGKEGLQFSGPAQVFESEDETNEAIQARKIKAGSVIVIRQSGPKGAPGMPEMLKPTGLLMGAGLGKEVALITDGRFSGGTHGFVVGHITPEGYNGGMIGLLEDGDIITIDADKNTIDVSLSDIEIKERRKNWKRPEKKLTGFLKKYRHTVSSASEGCITDGDYQ
ncbi:MAG: dihydroxy-acid dehydratase [Saprospiraceae bacterium]|jgi:dihydroxy-acid dehydratase|tara:strand:+ start:555 stop:2234 length:1680 start_codon:yes stop_codon:yes gene_type:complete